MSRAVPPSVRDHGSEHADDLGCADRQWRHRARRFVAVPLSSPLPRKGSLVGGHFQRSAPPDRGRVPRHIARSRHAASPIMTGSRRPGSRRTRRPSELEHRMRHPIAGARLASARVTASGARHSRRALMTTVSGCIGRVAGVGSVNSISVLRVTGDPPHAVTTHGLVWRRRTPPHRVRRHNRRACSASHPAAGVRHRAD